MMTSTSAAAQAHTQEQDPVESARASRLTFLLDKSTIYAKIIGDRMARQQIEKRKAEQRAEVRKANKEKKGEQVPTRGGTRKKVKEELEGDGDVEAPVEEGGKRKRRGEGGPVEKRQKVEDVEEENKVCFAYSFGSFG